MPSKSHSRSKPATNVEPDPAASQPLLEHEAAVQLTEAASKPLLAGQTRPRPPAASQAHPGVHPLTALTAAQPFEPLPKPLGQPPYHYELEAVIPGITATATAQGSLVFHIAGDTGGIKNPDYQTDVATAMKSDLALPADISPTLLLSPGRCRLLQRTNLGVLQPVLRALRSLHSAHHLDSRQSRRRSHQQLADLA